MVFALSEKNPLPEDAPGACRAGMAGSGARQESLCVMSLCRAVYVGMYRKNKKAEKKISL